MAWFIFPILSVGKGIRKGKIGFVPDGGQPSFLWPLVPRSLLRANFFFMADLGLLLLSKGGLKCVKKRRASAFFELSPKLYETRFYTSHFKAQDFGGVRLIFPRWISFFGGVSLTFSFSPLFSYWGSRMFRVPGVLLNGRGFLGGLPFWPGKSRGFKF